MAQLKIHNQISYKLITGFHVYRNIELISKEKLEGFLEKDLESIKSEFDQKIPDAFMFTRKLYKSFSIDPTKTRPASEKLWRRVKKEGRLPEILPIVDLTNHLSLKFQIPFGLYDLDSIDEYINIGEGTPSDSLLTIGNMVMGLDGKITLSDASGPFGNPTADSKRTATHPGTKNLIQTLYFHPDDPDIETAFLHTLDIMKTFFNWEKHHQQILSHQKPHVSFYF